MKIILAAVAATAILVAAVAAYTFTFLLAASLWIIRRVLDFIDDRRGDHAA